MLAALSPHPALPPSSPLCAACAQPSLLQLLPSAAEPSGEEVFIADSLNGIQLSHIKKALADAGETCHTITHSGLTHQEGAGGCR